MSKPTILSHLPRGIVGATIFFVKHGVMFKLHQFGERDTHLRTVLGPAYLPSGEVAYGSGRYDTDRYVFADLGKVLQFGNNHVVDVGVTLPSALHALRLKMLEDFYNFDLHGSICAHDKWPEAYSVSYRNKKAAISEQPPLVRDSDLPKDGVFVSKGAKIRWFCRNYEALKGLFT